MPIIKEIYKTVRNPVSTFNVFSARIPIYYRKFLPINSLPTLRNVLLRIIEIHYGSLAKVA